MTNNSIINLVNIKTKDGFAFNATIQFKKTQNGYISPIKLPNIPKDEVFNFQIVSFDNQKTILRVDTTNKETYHIVKIYSNPEKYQIIHLPSFKSTRRYISEEELLDLKTKSINLIENESLARLSFLNVLEFTDYSIEKIPFIFQWGELKNISYELDNEKRILIIENQFSPDDIIENFDRSIFLNLGYQDFEILKMRVSIVPESGIPISFITDHLNYLDIQKRMEKITSSTTIVFEEIFIKNKKDQTIFLPPAFRFIVE